MLPQLTILAAIGAMFCWGFGDFFIQKSARKIGDVETLAWIGFLGSLGLIPFVWKDFYLVLHRSNFLILLILGVVSFGVGIINFEALRRGKLSVVEVLLELELPVTVLLGLFFLKEYLNGVEVALIAAIFFGIILIGWQPGEIRGRHFFERGALLAVVTGIGYGLINFLTAVGAKNISPLLTIWFPWLIFTLICISYLGAKGRLGIAVNHARNYLSLIITIGILDTLAWLLFAMALQKKELAVTIAITESYPAISLLLGIKVNKENIFKHQLLGAAITIAGSFIMGMIA